MQGQVTSPQPTVAVGGKAAPPPQPLAPASHVAAKVAPDHLPAWLDFTSHVVGATAWPLTVILLALLFRKQLAGLLKNLEHLKYPGGEASFKREVLSFKTVVGAAEAELQTEIAQERATAPHADLKPSNTYEIAKAARALIEERWPGEAEGRIGTETVLDGWALIEGALVDAAETENRSEISPNAALRYLRDERLITPTTLNAVRAARELRNAVVHRNKRPADLDAVDYLITSGQLANTIRNEVALERAKRSGRGPQAR